MQAARRRKTERLVSYWCLTSSQPLRLSQGNTLISKTYLMEEKLGYWKYPSSLKEIIKQNITDLYRHHISRMHNSAITFCQTNLYIFKNLTMLSGEHPQNNNFEQQELQKKPNSSTPANAHNLKNVFYSEQFSQGLRIGGSSLFSRTASFA